MTEWREVEEPKIWASRFPRFLDVLSLDWTIDGKQVDFIHAFRDQLERIDPSAAPKTIFFKRHKSIPKATADANKIIGGVRIISPALHAVLMQFDMDGVQFFEVPIHAD